MELIVTGGMTVAWAYPQLPRAPPPENLKLRVEKYRIQIAAKWLEFDENVNRALCFITHFLALK